MKYRFGSWAWALLALSVAVQAPARSGGPDGFGYTFADSAEPGVAYAWEDISATGTDIMIDGDDVNYGYQPMSFSFPYYGGSYTQVAVCSNGWVSFVDDVSAAYANNRLPNAGAPTGPIAVFWDDLRGTTGVSRVLFQDFGTRVVITWEDVHDLGSNTAVNTFQVILHDDGRIKAQYQDLTGDRLSCTAGIESPDQLNGLTVWYDDPAGIPASNYAIEYYPPVPVPVNLDCSAPIVVRCSDRITADTRVGGVALQDAYLCSRGDYGGREIVYALNLGAPSDVRIILESLSGNQDLIVLDGCDPNRCLAAPSDVALLTNVSGVITFVVDSSAANEGAYNLRIDCLPLNSNVDCAGAIGINCSDRVSADTATGQARQDAYGCTLDDYAGREHVYRIDLAAPTNVEFVLTEISGNPDLILLTGCDPNACLIWDSGSVTVNDLVGSVYFVIDSAPGDEGQYELQVNCLSENMAFCATGVVEMDAWGYANGVWQVDEWFYHPGDTHDHALRVDGGTTYSTSDFGCQDFLSSSYGVRMPAGPAFSEWRAAEGSIRTELYETTTTGCCGLMVAMTVTNTDTVPHYFEYRAYFDTAFGTGDGLGNCGAGATIDGGPIEVNGVRYEQEIDLIAVGGTTCEGQLQMFSADHPNDVRSSYQMLPPNLPNAMEHLDWDDGGQPCTTWRGLHADLENLAGCSDNSVLFIWRFPQFGTLAPGESDTARYRIGWRCAWECNVVCEFPVLNSVTATDAGPCQGGIIVTWDAATFPGSGNGVYHVYRSTISVADALSSAPISAPGGITAVSFIDGTTVSSVDYYYAVVAESLDFPNCGTGPAVLGSTASAGAPVVRDLADIDPPTEDVGSALRATDKTDTTVEFKWTAAPALGPGDSYVVLRADDDPRGPFYITGRSSLQSWRDPDAPPRFNPVHVWFYDVRVADACDNMSRD